MNAFIRTIKTCFLDFHCFIFVVLNLLLIKKIIMKKIALIILATFISVSMFGQKVPFSIGNGTPTPPSRDNEFTCEANSQFSQVYSTYDNGFYCDDNYSFYAAADDYSASGSFSTMRFWGVNFSTCAPGATETFIIKFYELNTVVPSIPGTEMHSFTVTGTITDLGIVTPWAVYPCTIYQIDVDFITTVTLLDGWVSVTRQNPGDGCNFVWMGYGTGNAVSTNGTWQTTNGNLMFCLGGTPSIPISNWAIYLGIFLIAAFMVFRFRRRLV